MSAYRYNLICFIGGGIILILIALFSLIPSGCHDDFAEQDINNQQPSPIASSEQLGKSPSLTGVTTETNTVIFTKYSNGYDWQRADIQTKQHYCEKIAALESKEFKKEFNRGFTADFYYSALNSFYNSSDPKILSEHIGDIVGLATSAAIAGQ